MHMYAYVCICRLDAHHVPSFPAVGDLKGSLLLSFFVCSKSNNRNTYIYVHVRINVHMRKYIYMYIHSICAYAALTTGVQRINFP
jgi:NRPS condensation-like uncharacterized protein